MKIIRLITLFLLFAGSHLALADAAGHRHDGGEGGNAMPLHKHMSDMQEMMDKAEKSTSKKEKMRLAKQHKGAMKKHMEMMKSTLSESQCDQDMVKDPEGMQTCSQHLHSGMSMMLNMMEQMNKSEHLEHTLDDSEGE